MPETSTGRAVLPAAPVRRGPSPLAARRRHLLTRLYDGVLDGAALTATADRLEALLAAAPRTTPTRPLDETDAWLIAYPDHVQDSSGARSPLAALADLVDAHLSPAVTGVHTLPLHPSSSDGGFAVMDHAEVDPAYGSAQDVRRLAAGATWMADAVVNHVSAQGTWFTRWLAGDPAYAGFFRELDAGTPTTAVTRPRTSPLRTVVTRGDGREVGVWTTFSPDQVDLDYREPRVLLAMVEVLLRYVAQGARAIRLDAVGFAWKDPATPSLNLPRTHVLVQLFRACLDAVDPGLVLVTETNVPHAENVAYLGLDGEREAQAVYQFALPPLTLDAFVGGDATRLKEWARALWFPGDGRTYLTFLASHDGIGVRAVEGLLDDAALDRLVAATQRAGGRVNARSCADGSTRPYELAVSWAAVMGAGHDEATALRRHVSSYALALALRGVPLLYLGALLGAGNDEATFDRTGHARDLNRMRFDADDLELLLTSPGTREAASLGAISELLHLRRAHAAFSPDAAQVVQGDDPALVVVERVPDHGCRAVVAVNVSGSPVPLELPEGRWARVDSGADRRGAAQAAGEPLAAYGNAWFVEVR
ncbi:alpha-amylase family glycosyl hydrolase [Aquipuribacter nitratireducens]|uniref:Alpha-amylase family glycosyl hydrolase n=1 Tax=Aquipuribacter nitratireducens TaxID=650104 RepID=A0ABW0GTM5_9MICO